MLEVTDLHLAHGQSEAIHDVTLTVGTGEAVAIIGSNGAGKTTLLRAIAGLHPVREGEITFQDQSLVGMPAHRISRLGVSYVPAERHLFPDMTVAENLSLGAYPRSPSSDLYDFVFGLFPRLADRLGQRAGTMSGGEQQMLAIGRALMSEPSFLVLDEPSTGLAPILAEEAYEALDKLHESGSLTILVAEQQVPLALHVADRAYVLEDGRMALQGTSAELANNPDVQRAYMGIA